MGSKPLGATMAIPPPTRQIHRAVQAALDEDISFGDVTTQALFPRPTPARGTIVAHEPLVVAGVAVARHVFNVIDPSLKLTSERQDGGRADSGDAVLITEGDARSILAGERVALNFLQHLSGVASLTAQFCDAVRAYGTKVLDTRKTTPGLRALEKWAVRLGGGWNHRHSLGDAVLIKDNHIALLAAQRIGVAQACRLARERGPHGQRVIVEAQTLIDVEQAVEGGADVILLDNMRADQARQAVERVKGRALVEVSGGITLESAVSMAAAGVDAISIGRLTHSAPAMNLSMDLIPIASRTRRRPSRKRAAGKG